MRKPFKLETMSECLARTAKWKNTDKRASAILACAWFHVKADRSLAFGVKDFACDFITHAQEYIEMPVVGERHALPLSTHTLSN